MRRELLTHSRSSSFKECRKKHYFSYELAMRPITDAKALRQGSAFHSGIAALGEGKSVEEACELAGKHYLDMPSHFDEYDWLIERETVLRTVCAYSWRWSTMPLEYVLVETGFQLPLINPATGKATPSFDLAGKIDGIVRLEDGRLAIKESKFLGEDISHDGSLWRRLRRDSQVSIYVIAARRMGHDVDTVIYDVARKPTIAPTDVPILDENGLKIVLDSTGERVRNTTGKKEFRQTADKEKGYVLQTRPMTVQEWGEKLTADIVERPDYYFCRTELPRLDGDLAETEQELWEIQLAIRDAQKTGHWYRTTNKNTCPFCPYDSICDRKLEPGEVPEGFEILETKHPELDIERKENVSHSSSAASAASTTSPTSPAAPIYAEASPTTGDFAACT